MAGYVGLVVSILLVLCPRSFPWWPRVLFVAVNGLDHVDVDALCARDIGAPSGHFLLLQVGLVVTHLQVLLTVFEAEDVREHGDG